MHHALTMSTIIIGVAPMTVPTSPPAGCPAAIPQPNSTCPGTPMVCGYEEECCATAGTCVNTTEAICEGITWLIAQNTLPVCPPPTPSTESSPPSPTPRCTDDPSYHDGGFWCWHWTNYECRAGAATINTPERIARLVQACPEACADVEPVCDGGQVTLTDEGGRPYEPALSRDGTGSDQGVLSDIHVLLIVVAGLCTSGVCVGGGGGAALMVRAKRRGEAALAAPPAPEATSSTTGMTRTVGVEHEREPEVFDVRVEVEQKGESVGEMPRASGPSPCHASSSKRSSSTSAHASSVPLLHAVRKHARLRPVVWEVVALERMKRVAKQTAEERESRTNSSRSSWSSSL